MKLHYIELSIAVELYDDENPYDFVKELVNNSMDISSAEIYDVETKQL